jgi:hypothetical protein
VPERVTLKLGKREFDLTIDMTAIGDISEHTNVDLLSGGVDAQRALARPENFKTALWAFAGGSDTGLTPREFGRLLTPALMPAASEAVNRIFARDVNEPEEVGSGNASEAPSTS